MGFSKEFREQLLKELKGATSMEELTGKGGLLKAILKEAVETLLEAELTEQLGYEKYSKDGYNSGNSRNGKSKKTLKSSNGEIEIEVPRDRESIFNPIIVPKHQRVLDEIEDKIICLYARGVSTREIQTYIEEIYGVKLSSQSISNITETVMDKVRNWQRRRGLFEILCLL